MPDKDLEGDGPSLELPSFGFGRKKRRERPEASEPEVPATPEPGPEIDPGAEPEGPATPDRGPEIFPGVAPEVPATPSPGPMPPGEEPTRRPEIEPTVPTRPTEPEQPPEIDPLIPSAPPEHPTAPEIDPLVPTRPEWQPTSDPRPEREPAPDAEPVPDTEPTPDAEPVPDPVPVQPDVAPDDEPVTPAPPVEPDPEPHDRSTRVLPATPSAAPHPEPAAVAPYDSRVDDRAETLVDDRQPERGPAREPRGLRFPALPALPAVLLVGAVVGVAAVLMTWGSLRLCDTARGTASCGGGPGLLLLLAILIALTYLGGWLLRGFGVSDAGSTSFLAVGLLAVVAMLFLVDSLDEWSGAIAVPVVTVVAYALSWRVTAALVDAGADPR